MNEKDWAGTVFASNVVFEPPKDGWEYLPTNRRDIEDVADVYARAETPEQFREQLLRLKERDLES